MIIAISPTQITITIVHMIILEQHIRHLLEQLCDPLSQRVNLTTHPCQDHVSFLFISTIWLILTFATEKLSLLSILYCSLYNYFVFLVGAPNGTIYHSGNSTNPSHNHNNNPHHYDPNRVPNSGNYGQNYDNNRGSTTYRPFPSRFAGYQFEKTNGFSIEVSHSSNIFNMYPIQVQTR